MPPSVSRVAREIGRNYYAFCDAATCWRRGVARKGQLTQFYDLRSGQTPTISRLAEVISGRRKVRAFTRFGDTLIRAVASVGKERKLLENGSR